MRFTTRQYITRHTLVTGLSWMVTICCAPGACHIHRAYQTWVSRLGVRKGEAQKVAVIR